MREGEQKEEAPEPPPTIGNNLYEGIHSLSARKIERDNYPPIPKKIRS
jgi:hypothetical protein